MSFTGVLLLVSISQLLRRIVRNTDEASQVEVSYGDHDVVGRVISEWLAAALCNYIEALNHRQTVWVGENFPAT